MDAALAAAAENHATVSGVVVNQVAPTDVDRYAAAVAERVGPVPVVALPDVPLLRAPTMQDLAEACDAVFVHGDPDLLDRECLGIVVAAMTLPHVLDRLIEGRRRGRAGRPGRRSSSVRCWHTAPRPSRR